MAMNNLNTKTDRFQDPTASSGPDHDLSPVEIRVVALFKSFGGKAVLSNIKLEIRRGEMVAIVGPSGSGKTTLLRHLTGHFRPDRGTVYMADHGRPGSPLVDLATFSSTDLYELALHWGVVFQKNGLFSGTVYDSLALSLRLVEGLDETSVRQRITDTLHAVGLDVNLVGNVGVDELSGGMAKRVATAAALERDPILIFYDEPTAGLDPENSWQVQNLIREVHGRPTADQLPRTSLIITHEKELLAHLQPRIVMLDAGHLVFDGPYQTFEISTLPCIQPYLRGALDARGNPEARR